MFFKISGFASNETLNIYVTSSLKIYFQTNTLSFTQTKLDVRLHFIWKLP